MPNKNYMMNQPNTSTNFLQTSYQNTDYYPMNNTINSYNYSGSINQNNCDISYHNQVSNQRSQNSNNPQNVYLEQQFVDSTLWATSDLEKGFKFTDKIETIEISSKDLSPASCCSNIEQLFNYNTPQQKYGDFPSCSHIKNKNNMPKYCSIQKQNIDCDQKKINYFANQTLSLSVDQPNFYNQQNYSSLSIQIPKALDSSLSSICPLPLSATTDFFLNDDINLSFDAINNLDNTRSDESNSSDIVVEDTDDEYSETPLCEISSKCLVCNVGYSINGTQFYMLTKIAPLTMSSQKSVLDKLKELLGNLSFKCLNNDYLYLCSQCLGIINTIDHLQLKLQSCKIELDSKFGERLVKNVETPNQNKIAVNKNHGFNCKSCKKFIKFRTLFENHFQLHKVSKRFSCNYCGQRFIRHRTLYKHKLIHKTNISNNKKRPTSLLPYLCKICFRPFRTKSNLNEHENYCSGKLPFKCKLCYKQFISSTKLKSHIKLKHDKKFNSICSICNIGFIKPSAYKAHMVSHSSDKKYKCSKCDKSYKTIGNLNFHRKFHSETLPYNCGACAKGFMRKEYLEAHINIHNEVKNFSCTMCSKKFVSQKNLDAHFKYHDATAQKKVCNICFKTINTKLEEHLRKHTNLKEFECDLCDLKFNTKSTMSKHKKRKHANKENK